MRYAPLSSFNKSTMSQVSLPGVLLPIMLKDLDLKFSPNQAASREGHSKIADALPASPPGKRSYLLRNFTTELAAYTENWKNELKKRISGTVGKGKASVSPPQQQQEQEEQYEHNTQRNTQMDSMSAQPDPQQITMHPPELLTPRMTLKRPSTPSDPDPTQDTVQTSAQNAPRTAAPEDFKPEVDYKMTAHAS